MCVDFSNKVLTNTKVAGNTTFFQPKYQINQPNDIYEQEADAVAEQVVQSKPLHQAETFFKPTISPIQRKCDACEDEERLQRKEENGNEHEASGDFERYADGLNNSGSSLPNKTKSFFESRIGYDFSNVKIHTDTVAAKSAQSINALAYTTGNHIVFNQNQYQPETTSGKKLLAHELTHVVQQNSNIQTKKIQRIATSDFRITGLDPATELTRNTIRFDYNQTAVPPVENWKIHDEATMPNTTRSITLNGFASEDGSASGNTATVNARIANVSAALYAEGHRGARMPNPNPTGGTGVIDYRSRRIVEIVTTPVGVGAPIPSAVPSCPGGASTPAACGTTFSSAFPVSRTKLGNAITALSAPTAATLGIVSTWFGATPAGTISTNLGNLSTKFEALVLQHNSATDCHLDDCDSTCSNSDAYVDRAVLPHRMILCDRFRNDPSVVSRAYTILHESLHVTTGVNSQDIAYAHTRRIRTLSDAEKLINTDSYINLIMQLQSPQDAVATAPMDSPVGVLSAAETDFARNAIAFLEQWLIKAYQYTSDLHTEINTALTSPAAWTSTPAWYHTTMHNLSGLFGLTDPGTAVPFTTPVMRDKIRIAGIYDRYLKMRERFHGPTVSFTKVAGGIESFVEGSPDLFTLSDATFFTSPLPPLLTGVQHLLDVMIAGRADIPSALRTDYRIGADLIRTQDGVGP